jgi:HME family heavy-metal exporter
MLNAIIRFALRYRALIVVIALVVLGYGTYLASTMTIDVFPELDRPRVTILTECHGLAAEEVETLVTFPIEAAVIGASGVTDVRSQSAPGFSSVVVEFDWGVEQRYARQVVQERLATITADLPPDVRPFMAPPGALMGQIILAGLRRLSGPNGGQLAPVPNTPYVVEVLSSPTTTTAPIVPHDQIRVWRPYDRRDPASWSAVPYQAARWQPPDREGNYLLWLSLQGQIYWVPFPNQQKRSMDLRTLADWTVRPRLLKVPGVAQVLTVGGGRKQYHVLVDPFALHEFDLSLHSVEEAVRQNNLNTSGGLANLRDAERSVRIIGRLGPESHRVLSDLPKIPLRSAGQRPVLLEQVARVVEAPQLPRGDASINGQPGVLINIIKQPQADTRRVTAAVQEVLRQLETTLPADVIIDHNLYQQRDFIDRGVYNVGEALVVGACLVLVILFVFLLNFRTTFISLTAIPLSLAITAIVFRIIGQLTGTPLSINIMTLGGLAVAIGELVDDSVVDVENIFRRLRENAHAPQPRSPLRVIYEASLEIRSSIVFGTLVVILVFLPLFALSGMEGRLFTPLAIAYVTSILASLLVSLTLTPVLSYYLLVGAPVLHRERDSLLIRALKAIARRLIRCSMRYTRPLLLLTWLLVAYSAWRLTRLGADFLPAFDEGTVQISVLLPSGSSLQASNQVAAVVDRLLQPLQVSPTNPHGEILTFARRTGRSELDEHADPPNETEFFVTINPHCGKSRTEVLQLLRSTVVEALPGVDVEVEQPLAHLISHLISGSTAQIAIKIYGDDLNVLERLANEVRAQAATVPGVSSLVIERMGLVDEVHIKLDPEALAYYGVSREYLGRFLQTALQGAVVSQVIEGQRRFDLVVRFDEPYRSDLANLGHLHLDLPDGRHIHLEQLARITPPTGGDLGANQVKRENLRRRLIVRCNAQGRDLASVVRDIQQVVADRVPLPEGYFIEYGGQFESQQRATRTLMILAGISAIGIFLVLLMPLPSIRIVLQILNAVPTAFIGGVWALILTGQTVSIASLVGFISLGGIAIRNSILLMNHYIHLMRCEGETFSETLILRGTLERLTPVLMTALTASLALLPLVIGGHQPGREILYPVATVILGGILTATFCQFLIHPGVFWRFCGRDAYRLATARSTDETDTTDRP